MLEARAAVRRLKEYHPPLGGRVGLRLDFNENTVGCSPRVLERLRQLQFDQLARYPERESVERQIAAHLGVDCAGLLLTNGVDEAIHLVCETYLEAGDQVLIVVPTFSMYEIYAAATGAQVITIPAGAEFCHPTDDVLARISQRTRLITIANPNNPTGAVVARSDLLRILRAAPDTAVLVDEAYFDFYGESLLAEVASYPNVFVARTFSKAYGLAGLRIGVLVGSAAQMAMVRRVGSPYNVNAVALACLPEALADQDYVRQYVAEVRQGRERLEQELHSLQLRYWPSQANFVLVKIGERHDAFVRAMRERGILVRDRSRDPGCDGCVRISVGSNPQTERLIGTLREAVRAIASTGVPA
ncbi:MAG: histidinol-phosphate transaminase [Terriglobales bacterium]